MIEYCRYKCVMFYNKVSQAEFLLWQIKGWHLLFDRQNRLSAALAFEEPRFCLNKHWTLCPRQWVHNLFKVKLKCLSPQRTLSTLFILSNTSCFLEPFDYNFSFLMALKDGKSGHTVINNRAMKGNGFDTGLTSQINLHRCFQIIISMQSSLWRQPNIKPIPLHCSLMDQIMTAFPVFKANKNVKFQSKGSKDNTMYLERFRRINILENVLRW